MKAAWPNQQAHVGENVAVIVAFADTAHLDGERRRGTIGVPTDVIPLHFPDRDESASVDEVQRHVCVVFAIGVDGVGGFKRSRAT